MALLGSVFVPSCPHIGPILAHLGCMLAACWPILSHLDPSCPILAPSWPILAPSWSHLGPPWLHLGPSWPHLGPILAPWPHLAQSWPGVSSLPAWLHRETQPFSDMLLKIDSIRPRLCRSSAISFCSFCPVHLCPTSACRRGGCRPPHPPAFDQASVQGVRARGVVSSVPRVSLLPLLKSSTT